LQGVAGKKNDNQDHWLDKAKPVYGNNEVEDAKVALRALRIMVPLPFFWMIFFQMYSIWVHQAELMNRSFGSFVLPPEESSTLNGLLDLLLIPVFDKLVYPFFEQECIRKHFHFTPLKRMVAGHIFTIAALCVAGYVSMLCQGELINNQCSIHVAWIVPQYILISIAEILLSITAIEFAYSEAPPSMKGTMSSILQCTVAIGNGLISVIARMPFDLWIEDFVLAGLILVVLFIFTLIAMSYTYRDDSGSN